MIEFSSDCDARFGVCTVYRHAHCASCDSVVEVEPCCGDPECHNFGYANGAQCADCNECVLCDNCRRMNAKCPHCSVAA